MYNLQLTTSHFPKQNDANIRNITVGGVLREVAAMHPDATAMVHRRAHVGIIAWYYMIFLLPPGATSHARTHTAREGLSAGSMAAAGQPAARSAARVAWDCCVGHAPQRRPDLPPAQPGTPGRGTQLTSMHGRPAQPQRRAAELQLKPSAGLKSTTPSTSGCLRAC